MIAPCASCSAEEDDDFAELLAVALSDGDGLVVFLRVYIDESGIHDPSPVTTVAVILSQPKLWRKWTAEWNLAKAPIKVFHAEECANLRGAFKGWDATERDAYVANLLPVIGRFHFAGHVVGIDNRDVERLQAEFPRVKDRISLPYMTCLQLALHRTLDYLNDLGGNDRVGFIHEDNDYKGAALACFDWMKTLPAYAGREMSFTFASKKQAPPLQAADCFAYEGNKRIRNIDGPERRAWRAMNPARNKIRLDHFEYNGLKNWLEGLERQGVQVR